MASGVARVHGLDIVATCLARFANEPTTACALAEVVGSQAAARGGRPDNGEGIGPRLFATIARISGSHPKHGDEYGAGVAADDECCSDPPQRYHHGLRLIAQWTEPSAVAASCRTRSW
jgi:hypothetical protein